MKLGVCVIIVTYNRSALLAECLAAVIAQDHALAAVLVIDNASSDGTSDLFQTGASMDARVRYIRLPINLGGAGGFRHGMEAAQALGFEWLWLMDDDTIPEPTALSALLAAWESFPEGERPVVLASTVRWVDGSTHPMNFPTVRRADADRELTLRTARRATLWIRWASFVSVLVHHSAIAKYGLPYGDYFIWSDDTEYTARILRRELGVLVPASEVTHKTPRKHSSLDASAERSYYQARNVLWMILRSSAWTAEEKVKVSVFHLKWVIKYLAKSRFGWAASRSVLAGLRDGLLTAPRE